MIADLRALRRRDLWLIVVGGVVAGLLLAAVVVVAEPFPAFSLAPGEDSHSYWAAPLADPYRVSIVGAQDFYPYSPAFLQAIAPLKSLPWAAFSGTWTAVLLVALLILTGPRSYVFGLFLALPELWGGNIHLLLALAVAAGLRRPGAWAFVLLAKVTPGVGLLWFALRREWRALAVACGVTALIVVFSFALLPAAWWDWWRVLMDNAGVAGGVMSRGAAMGSVGPPFVVRVPLAIALIAWGAHTDRPWLLPVAAMLAQPLVWFGGLTVMLGAVPYLRGASWARPATVDAASDRQASARLVEGGEAQR